MSDKKSLLIVNNFCQAVAWAQKSSAEKVYFAPIIKSEIQRAFFEKRFQEIRKTLPQTQQVCWKDLVSALDTKMITIAAWPTYEESQKLDSQHDGQEWLEQNRLFPGELPFSLNSKMDFTPFRKKIEPYLPKTFTDTSQYQDDEVLDHVERYFSEPKRVKSYFETRNQMTGDFFATKMSRYLSCGALSVRYLYNRVKQFEKEHGGNKSTYWIIFELLWREFFYHSGRLHGNLIFSRNGIQGPPDFETIQWNEDALVEHLKSNDFAYCAYKELKKTGFQSNRTRQLFASFLINDIKWDWRVGAELFEKYLIDYDVYSNYGNWQYLAGIGHDPRGHRYFNQEQQLERYDPENNYVQTWLNA